MLRLDFYRVFHRKRLWFLLPVTLVFCYMVYTEALQGGAIPEGVRLWFPLAGAWSYWVPVMGGTSLSVFNILSCILVALPACDLFYEDRKTRLSIPLLQNSSRRRIAASHFTTAFCTGFVLMAIPLIAQILCVFSKTPILPIAKHYIPEMTPPYLLFPSLYVSSPLLYMVFTVIRCSMFGGIVACIALSVNYWAGGAYLGLVLPCFAINVFGVLWNRLMMMLSLPENFFAALFIRFPVSAEKMMGIASIELGLWVLFCVGTLLHASRERELL